MLPMNFKEHQLYTEKGRQYLRPRIWQDVILRVQASIRNVLQQQGPGHGILLVCHSWVNKALIASVTPGLGLKRLLDVPQRNCAVNVLDYCHGAGHFKLLAVDLVAGTRAARFWGMNMTKMQPQPWSLVDIARRSWMSWKCMACAQDAPSRAFGQSDAQYCDIFQLQKEMMFSSQGGSFSHGSSQLWSFGWRSK